jgi:hypothetical protein
MNTRMVTPMRTTTCIRITMRIFTATLQGAVPTRRDAIFSAY